jgi:membrane protein implicated in regulation of membrane protease activity
MLTCFYLSLLILGGGYIAVTFIVGELVDLDEGVGHVIEGLGGGVGEALSSLGDMLEGVLGGAEAVGVDVGDIDVPDIGEMELEHDVGEPSPFSLRTLAMFAVGFGAGGLMGKGLGMSDPLSLIPAGGMAFAGGATMWLALRFVYAGQGTSTIQARDYLGVVGRVIIAIPEGRPGRVALNVKGQRINMPARSENGCAIAAHTQVEVLAKEGATVVVRALG